MEAGASCNCGSAGSALSERSDRFRVGTGCAADQSRQTRRASSHGRHSRSTNAIFYVLWTGCQWKALPKDLPPRSTVWEYLDLWDWDGTLGRIHHALYVEVREKAGREGSPTTAIIDSQTAKGALKGGLRSTPRAMTLARRCLAASATS